MRLGTSSSIPQYRDLTEFELVSPLQGVVPLESAKGVNIGDAVLTVGNALGSGIVVRSGSLTSFTPEEMEGRWKFIRFTAPASPGNSGGPLVDKTGRVAGVVVRRSDAENLNYAVPIEELDNMSASSAELWIRGLSFAEDNGESLRLEV